MKAKKVLLISPPFSSQLAPMLALARGFADAGIETTVACSELFEDRIRDRGLGFVSLTVNRNANTGVAQSTNQPEEERRRLEAFLESTKRGAVETLMLQSRDRRADMLADPERLQQDLIRIDERERPDLWVANQLSYAVTLVLHGLGLPYVSFCAPHPLTIPEGDKIYGVPAAWPAAIRVDAAKLEELERMARRVERAFTYEFNRFLARTSIVSAVQSVKNAFRLTSPKAVLCNYPDLAAIASDHESYKPPDAQNRIYLGACLEEQELPKRYRQFVTGSQAGSEGGPIILIVMGTFLSYRTDVLRICIEAAKRQFHDSVVMVGAGASQSELANLPLENVLIEEFLPQKALLPHVDLVVHHGGNNSFTESLYFGKPMVILPFSSDQFDIAADAERIGVAEVSDPNRIEPVSFGETMKRALARDQVEALRRLGEHVRRRGPRFAVEELGRLGL
jgi:UDP:flavonoid glycosyltransferase YjiC (YdhE family)